MNEAQAADTFGFAGELVAGVRFAGVSVTTVIRLNRTEVARRDAAGLGAITDRDLLETLAQLPEDWPVAQAELDPVTLKLLEAAPPGVVDVGEVAVTRRWRPALTVTGVLLTSSTWQAGLRTVSLFAADAPRGLVLTRPPRDLAPLALRARELGVGLLAPDPTGAWQLGVEPKLEPAYAPGPRHWRLLENTYLAWRRLVVQRSAAQLFR